MVKISFQSLSKENDGDKTEILIPHPDEEEEPVRPQRSKLFPLYLFQAALLIAGLIVASALVYQKFCVSHMPEEKLFHCRVRFDDSGYAAVRGRQELEEQVGIYLGDNYQKISVPVPHFGGSDPADIIHDFNRGLTAYHDIILDKCYVIELNTAIVMPPRNLWELLVNVKNGTYLPQTYMVHEDMVVTAKVHNLRLLGPFISRLCSGKDTYRLSRRPRRRRVSKRQAKDCARIRHFENSFVVETVICDQA